MPKHLKRKDGPQGQRAAMPKTFKEKRQRLEMRTTDPSHVVVPRPNVPQPLSLADLSTPRTTGVGPLADSPGRTPQRAAESTQVRGPASFARTEVPMAVDGTDAPVGIRRSSGIKTVYARVISALQPHTWSWRRTRREATGGASSSAVTVEQMDALTDAASKVGLSDNPSGQPSAAGRLRVTVEDVSPDEELPDGEWDADVERAAEWDPAIDVDVRISREEAHLPSKKMEYFRKAQESNAQLYMDRRESPPATLDCCPKCSASLQSKSTAWRTLFRCEDCHQVQPSCVDCVLAAHAERPFDRIRMWSVALGFWQKKTLGDLGFLWHFGHAGGPCDTNHSMPRRMTFIHEHGILDMDVKFCQCQGAPRQPEQLIAHGCWPATWKTPNTAITLSAMSTYHGLELQGQINVHDYVHFLRRQTDGVEPDAVKDRYREFNNSMREYRQVRARRRHGVPLGATVGRAELAVLCPACPHPEKNMRPGWKERDPAYRYIDALTYSIDGNFHLGSKAKETDPNDVALSEGAAYFVNTKDFQTYLEKSPEPPVEASTCNQFGAMGQGKYKGKVSGLIAITCRHMFLLPGGIVDLLLGEKYRYVDFALVSALQDYLVLLLLIGTYDIHCQYIRNLRKRLKEQFDVVLDELDSIVSAELPEIVAAVGKYHLCMHKGECRTRHSLHYLPGSCMTDGEMLERIWAVTNGVARRTKEMSAGHRHDVLNDHYSDLNVRRLHSMVDDLMEKLRVADEMAEVATTYLNGVENTVDPEALARWKVEERLWKEKVVDIKQHDGLDNPYEPPRDATLTSRAILEQIHEERAAKGLLEQSADVSIVHTVLDLREQKANLTSRVHEFKGNEQERSRLVGRLEAFRERAMACRETYDTTLQVALDTAMADVKREDWPSSFPDRDEQDDMTQGLPLTAKSKGKGVVPPTPSPWVTEMLGLLDDSTFRLPSDCHSEVRRKPSLEDFVKIERALREGQANEALDALRLHLTTYLALKVRKAEGSGVIHNTESDRRLQEKREVIEQWKATYREIRQVLLVLGMPDNNNIYQPLLDDDCKPFTILVSEDKIGKSYKVPTWIWGDFRYALKLPPGELKSFVGHALSAHWFRHSALKMRWEEEVNVRLEEMWRTVQFFAHQEREWLERAEIWATKYPGTAVVARR
ncbi:hypothetical protein TRAPUB_11843 [Trametes pubescens]|uniref:CxC2-like cysteine cluster KDZ transposase-associated domain-containing protein n=1 Tax=Trametes pubescens TaxID=154538 RepID=A0A1M2VKS9_TRAPU|nr:hypothetical protein TRAPUB_939 [Trametes pubescens]OJT10114.1 hypothetical protein TRAPUB_13404 [Trametes pubescens]OJT11637.1 hypothetical protein TRAPUB_11843 [Trametes pubescens]